MSNAISSNTQEKVASFDALMFSLTKSATAKRHANERRALKAAMRGERRGR